MDHDRDIYIYMLSFSSKPDEHSGSDHRLGSWTLKKPLLIEKGIYSHFLGVSIKGGTPKSSIYRWIFYEINQPFGGTPFMDTLFIDDGL